jgi:hypothetical protein
LTGEPSHIATHTPCSVSASTLKHIACSWQSSMPLTPLSSTVHGSPGAFAKSTICTHLRLFHDALPSANGMHFWPGGQSSRNVLHSVDGASGSMMKMNSVSDVTGVVVLTSNEDDTSESENDPSVSLVGKVGRVGEAVTVATVGSDIVVGVVGSTVLVGSDIEVGSAALVGVVAEVGTVGVVGSDGSDETDGSNPEVGLIVLSLPPSVPCVSCESMSGPPGPQATSVTSSRAWRRACMARSPGPGADDPQKVTWRSNHKFRRQPSDIDR